MTSDTDVTHDRRRRIVAAAGTIAGIAVLALTAYWLANPLAPATPLEGRYGGNPVLAIEFARTPADVAAIIGPEPPTAAHAATRAHLDRIDRVDFGYMLAYAALLAAACWLARSVLAARLAWAGVALAVVGAVADVLENLALFALTANATDAAALASLQVWTTVKWTLLALVNGVLALACWRWGGIVRRVVAVLGAFALPLAAATFIAPAAFSGGLVTSFVPVWLAAFVECALTMARRR